MKFLNDILVKAGLVVQGNTDLQGVSTAVTPSSGDSSTKIATTAFVKNLGYVPSTRTITINGVTYDLSSNRTWNALPLAGTAGQILAKVDGTDFNTEWIDNFTSQVKHIVKAGEAVTKGQAVYVSSADGTNMIISKASNNTEGTSSKTMGLIAQDLATNGQGYLITEGLLAGLNTTGANAGDPVWLGTNGNLLYGLANKPVAPNHMVFIGIVTRVNSNNGEIFVKVQNGFEMEELHNALLTSKANKDIIYWDSATSLWKNASVSTVLGYTPLQTETDPIYTASSWYGTTNNSTNWDSAYTFTSNFPSQTGNSGKYLTTNGSTLSWATVSGGTNIYNSDGTLTGNRTITASTYKLSIVANSTTAPLELRNNNTAGVAAINLFDSLGTNIGAFGYAGSTYAGTNLQDKLYFYTPKDFIITPNGSTSYFKVFTSTGNITVNGTSDSGYKLDVSGTIRSDNTITGSNLVSNNNIQTGNILYGTNFDIRSATGNAKFGAQSAATARIESVGSLTAATGIARGVYLYNTLVASANNDVLVGLDVAPTFTAGAFTGVSNYALRVNGQTRIIGTSTTSSTSFEVTDSSGVSSFYIRGFGDAILKSTLYIGAVNGSNFISNGSLGIVSNQGTGNAFVTFTHNNADVALKILSNSNIQLNPSNGNVLVGTTTDAGYKLDVSGGIRATGNVTGSTIIANNNITVTNVLYSTSYYLNSDGRTKFGAQSLPDASALVEVVSTTKGFLAPRMTSAQRAAISTPAVGLLVYQTDGTEGYYEYASTGWRILYQASGGGGSVTSVGLIAPTGFSVTNSPITTSGDITLSFASGYSLPTTASQTNWDTAYTNRITSLTTTGTSGAATLIGNTLNIPQYSTGITINNNANNRILTANGGTTSIEAESGLTWDGSTMIGERTLVNGVNDIINAKSGNSKVSLSYEYNGTTSYPRVYFNYTGTFPNAGFVNQLGGVSQFFFGMSNEGTYGGTADANSGRFMGYYDYIASAWRYGFNASGELYLGQSNTTYNIKLSSSGSSFASGNVMIGTTTNAGYKLDVNGTLRVQGAATMQEVIPATNVTYSLGASATRWLAVYANTFSGGSSNLINLYPSGTSTTSGIKIYETAQGGGIATITDSAFTLQDSSVLNLVSTTRGFLGPRMTSAQRTAITSPATGLMVYQTDGTEGYYEKTSTGWRIINTAGGGSGTVTSVGLTVPTGFSVSNSPITTSGDIALSFASGYSLPTTTKQTNWDDAYAFVSNFPTQTGNAGRYLTTDGSSLSWGVITPGGYTVTSKTANYTETANSGTIIIKGDTTGGSFTITLPSAVENGAMIVIKKVAGTASLVVDGNGSETIDGGLTASLVKVGESITLISDSTNWQII